MYQNPVRRPEPARYGEQFPWLKSVAGHAIDFSLFAKRVESALRSRRCVTWGDVALLTDQVVLDTRNTGVGTLKELRKTLAIPATDCDYHPSTATPRDDIYLTIGPDISTLATWGAMSGCKTVGDLIATLTSDSSLPPDIRALFNDLADHPLDSFADPEAECGEDLCFLLLAKAKDPVLFIQRELSQPRPTLQQLADSRGLTREGIRQELVVDDKRIRSAMALDERHARLRWAAYRVRVEFGLGVPVASPVVEEVLGRVVADLGWDHPSCKALVLFLAGPYRPRDGWLTRDPETVEQFATLEKSLRRDHWILSQDEVDDYAVANGFTPATVGWKLQESPYWRELDDGRWLVWAPSLVDRSEVVLRLERVPLTASELLDHVGEGSEVSLRGRLNEDPRFIKCDNDGRFGLAEWGGENYEGIAVEIQKRIKRGGGKASVTGILADFVSKFRVAESSVRMNMNCGPFVVEGDDIFAKKDTDVYDPGRVDDRSDTIKIGDLWGQRVPVWQRHLDGHSFALNRDVAAHNGVLPNDSLVVPVTWNDEPVGEASIIWRLTNIKQSVDVGRLSSVLRSHGVSDGDQLIIAPSAQRCVIYTPD